MVAQSEVQRPYPLPKHASVARTVYPVIAGTLRNAAAFSGSIRIAPSVNNDVRCKWSLMISIGFGGKNSDEVLYHRTIHAELCVHILPVILVHVEYETKIAMCCYTSAHTRSWYLDRPIILSAFCMTRKRSKLYHQDVVSHFFL